MPGYPSPFEELTVPAQTYVEPLKTHNYTYTLSCPCSHTDLFVRLMHGNTKGKTAFTTVNQSKFVFESWQKTKLVMERGSLRKKRGIQREKGQRKRRNEERGKNNEKV